MAETMAAPWATQVIGSTRVERLRLLAGQLLGDVAADERNLAGAADEQDLVDVLGPHAAQLQRLVDGRARLDDQRHDDPSRSVPRSISSSRLRCRSGTSSALRATAVCSRRQLDLGLLDGEHELLLVRRIQDVEAGLLLEAVGDDLAQGGVDVVAAELADALAG